jgi:general secretion pathway protein D
MTLSQPFAVVLTLLLAACGSVPVQAPSTQHISAENVPQVATAKIPEPVQTLAAAPRPRAAAKVETYSVVVSNVRAQDLLFALARDAKLNVDVHPGITGTVTMNAIDQTLPQLLNRIGKQVDMRWELDGPNLTVMPDSPYLHTYKVDYVNMTRDVTSTIASNNRVSSATSGGSSGGGGGASGNVSTTHIDNTVKNRFWETLEKNVKDLLRETDKILPEGSSETVVERSDLQATSGTGAEPQRTGSNRSGTAAQANIANSPNPATLQQAGTTVVRRTTFREAASVIVNPETGVVTIRATSRQHEKIQEYLDNVTASSRRQVLIEATIVEVALSNTYTQGIDWSRLRGNGSGFAINGSKAGAAAISSFTPFTLHSLSNTNPLDLSLEITLKLLESFGNVKVLSTPKISVLNNQTAILRVVEDFVYFKVDESVTAGQTGSAQKSITTTPQTVSVGLTLSVTPQIGDSDSVMLDVRPTITSVSALVADPNPDLTVANNVPQLKTRELESVMRVASGDIAVLGGLMEDKIDYNNNRVPLLGQIPFFGELLTNRNNNSQKTELVVFLRPVVVKDASLNGDYAGFREVLPAKDIFQRDSDKFRPLNNLGDKGAP